MDPRLGSRVDGRRHSCHSAGIEGMHSVGYMQVVYMRFLTSTQQGRRITSRTNNPIMLQVLIRAMRWFGLFFPQKNPVIDKVRGKKDMFSAKPRGLKFLPSKTEQNEITE